MKDRAGWEWESAWGSDDQPLFEEMLRVLAPHAPAWRSSVDAGSKALLSLVGEVRGSLIDSQAEALRRNLYVAEDRSFEPFFDCDRPGPYLSNEAIEFLAAIGAAFDTHIDVGLDSDPDGT